MGYELTLHIIQTWAHDDRDPMNEFNMEHGRGGNQIAMVELSKPGYDSEIYKLVSKAIEDQKKALEEKTIAPWVIYTHVQHEDAEGVTHELNHKDDSYGSPITAIPIQDVYQALRKDFADSLDDFGGAGYRRFELALNMIRDIIRMFPEGGAAHGMLYALTYGH